MQMIYGTSDMKYMLLDMQLFALLAPQVPK